MIIENEFYKNLKLAITTALETEDIPDLTEETKLFDDLGFDSTSSISLLSELENKFKEFAFDPDTIAADDFKTVGSLVKYIKRSMT